MKKFFCALLVSCAVLFPVAAQEGTMGSGIDLFHTILKADHGDDLNTFGIGLRYQYCFSDQLRLDNGVNIAFEKKDINTWNTFAELEYLIPTGTIYVYPLAGVMYGNIKHRGSDIGREASFGFNFGGGVDIPVAYALTFNAEAKYSTCKYDDYDVKYSLLFSAGFIYNF